MSGSVPDRDPDGQFSTFIQWVNKATSWIGGENALCVDKLGRVCRCGGDFMRARDEDAFPVRFYYGAGGQTPTEQRKCARIAARKLRRGWM